MRYFLPILILSSLCFSQTQGLLPIPEDSVIADTLSQSGLQYSLATPENVAVGDTLLYGVYQNNSSTNTVCSSGPYTPSDTLGNTWTSFTNVQTTSFTHGGIQLFCTVSGFSGADTISFNADTNPAHSCLYSSSYMRIPATLGITCTKDSEQSATYFSNTSGVGTMSVSNSPSVNGAPLVTLYFCSGCQNSAANEPQNIDSQTIDSNTGAGSALFMSLKNTGIAGSNTTTIKVQNGNQVYSMDTVGLDPTGITIITTGLADCAISVVCNEYLQAIGGSGTYTWSVTAGSVPGMSMTNTSLGQYTGTPSAQGTTSLTFHVTDGTVSTSKTLSLKVGTSFRTLSVAQFATNNFDNGGATLTPLGSNVSCGDSVIMQLLAGDDTHVTEGWLQHMAGSGNYYTATVGGVTVVGQRVPNYGGTFHGPDTYVAFGPFLNSGAFVVNGFNNQGASSGLSAAFFDIHNAQGVIDLGVNNANKVVTDGTVTSTFTTLEPNSMVLNQSNGLIGDTGVYSGVTMTTQTTAPLVGNGIISSPSTNTLTSTMTSHSGCSPNCQNNYASTTLVLRPRLPMSVCGEVTGKLHLESQIY